MASGETTRVFAVKRLEAFIASVLGGLGLPESDAATCAARMTESDLRGVDTHGIFR
ncbi:MAG: Malate/L-lactate dehydrogenase, partial [candidate division NC10 bacterium]|nr:Malate/L-lactate dehydrogenase [candidate division NC10 bacterium]